MESRLASTRETPETGEQILRLLAPAKVNLTLEVLARRPDGYHGIRSLMVPLALADEIVIEPATHFSFSCDDESLSTPSNLIVRAFETIFGEKLPPLNVTLKKNIPIEAGLGGGSSDAAAILLAAIDGSFKRFTSTKSFASADITAIANQENWVSLARSLGSDVPFFLTQTGALVEGTGERVTAAGALPDWNVLIVKPPVAISTAEAYAEFDRLPQASRPRNESRTLRALAALQRGNFRDVEVSLWNDFHNIMLGKEPSINQTIDALRAAGATNILLTGSGSCVFTLAPNPETRNRIAERLKLPTQFRVYSTQFAASTVWK